MKPYCSTNITGGVRRHSGSLQGSDERSALVLLHGRSTPTQLTMFGATFTPARPRSAGPHGHAASARASPPRRDSRTGRWFARNGHLAPVSRVPVQQTVLHSRSVTALGLTAREVVAWRQRHGRYEDPRSSRCAPRSARPRGRADAADDQGDQVPPTLGPVLSLTIAFARLFAAVFEMPFLRHRSWPQDAGQRHPCAEGAPG
jgi:hypothetical protein